MTKTNADKPLHSLTKQQLVGFVLIIVLVACIILVVCKMTNSAPFHVNAHCVRDFRKSALKEFECIKSIKMTGDLSGMHFEYTLDTAQQPDVMDQIVEKTRVLFSDKEFLDAFNSCYKSKYGDTYFNIIGATFDGLRDNPRMYVSFKLTGEDEVVYSVQFDYPYTEPVSGGHLS